MDVTILYDVTSEVQRGIPETRTYGMFVEDAEPALLENIVVDLANEGARNIRLYEIIRQVRLFEDMYGD